MSAHRFLIFLISLFATAFTSIEAQELDSIAVSSPLQHYTFQIETKSGAVSGIFIVNDADDSIKGSMINEFGVSAIDFNYSKSKGKVKLLNVISFLNKWYIKRVLSNDIAYCLHVLYDTPYNKKHSYTVEKQDGITTIMNTKRNITYSFIPLENDLKNYDTEE